MTFFFLSKQKQEVEAIVGVTPINAVADATLTNAIADANRIIAVAVAGPLMTVATHIKINKYKLNSKKPCC